MVKEIIFSISKRKRTTWTSEEDSLLLNMPLSRRNKWVEIAKELKGKTPYQCFTRFRTIQPCIRKGSFKKEEDTLILFYSEQYGKSWAKIAEKIKTRTPKQIRERYANALDPDICKGKFSLEEDIRIMELHDIYGNKWASIHQQLPTRSPDQIKNRYNSSISRKIKLLRFLDSLGKQVKYIIIMN